MAGEANPDKEASPTSRTVVGRGCNVGAGRSDLPHLAFLLSKLYKLFLCSSGSCWDSTVPGGAIGSKCLLGLHVNGEVDIQVVLDKLLLPSNSGFSLGELSLE